MTHVDLLSLDDLLMKRKGLRRQLSTQTGLQEIRIAVLGGSTTNEVVDLLEFGLLSGGFRPTFHQCEYGPFYEDAVHDPQALIDFRPDLVYLHTSYQNVQGFPPLQCTDDEVQAYVDAEVDRYQQIWASLEKNLACQMIQNNFELPAFAILGNMDAVANRGHSAFVMRLNLAFAKAAQTNNKLLIQDVHGLSARMGLNQWVDRDRWFSYMILNSAEASRGIAQSVTSIVRALYGHSRLEVKVTIRRDDRKLVSKAMIRVVFMSRVILITGASSDIGMTLTRTLMGAADAPTVLAPSFRSGEKIRLPREEFGDRVHPVEAGFTDSASVKAMAEDILRRFGSPHRVVRLRALRLSYERFTKFNWERFSEDLSVQVHAAVLLLQKFLPKMDQSRVGFVLSSVTHGMPPKFIAEYAGTSVRINGISPSMVDTQFLQEIAEVAVQMSAAANPQGRNATPADLMGAIEFLLSPLSGYITGVDIPIAAGSVC